MSSPALRHKQLCYYHEQMRVQFVRHKRAKRTNIKNWSLPILEDATSIQAALMQTINAIVDDTIDRRKGALVLYGLQTASSNLKAISSPHWKDVVVEP